MKILVVEDEHAIADAVRRGLEGEGIAVDVMRDGVDGLWAATENAYDALVLDLMLPGLSGRDVLVGLRERGIWTPVLVLTARDGDAVQVGMFDRGADDFLAKPFSFEVLLARLRALVRRGAPERPVVLSAGDLRLEPARRRVTRGGTEIALTPREYGVLELLLRRGGDVVTKSEILSNVWDSAYEGDPNVVEVYVSYLRRKVDAPFGRRSILTVRGQGYRIAGDDT
ncbi:response regulator transcription factor [Cellulomonas sp. PhB150]|uniref:response regulator transcription factor n=1 Tax=Cellulomonas sp. PhB150 TaxID=2485188 RepID=UPI000F4789F2|nr:response regulator transcription factor [Cellulomonas sp. PhB150]ROS30580.1 two-component system OmpR family response regulator [Cellulomonas sp. PhB150]